MSPTRSLPPGQIRKKTIKFPLMYTKLSCCPDIMVEVNQIEYRLKVFFLISVKSFGFLVLTCHNVHEDLGICAS